MRSFHNRQALGAAIALSLGTLLSGCGGMPQNLQLESVHQPVVSRTNYTLDLATNPGGLSLPEARRLAGWFEAMDLRYGDRISIDDPLASAETLSAVEAVAARFGLLVSETAPVTPGAVNPGTARIVVMRSSAQVPGCPDWSARSDFNPKNATSTNYGCASNANLAAMVADPEHLLKGANGSGRTVVMSGTKAIETYREAKPTGEGGLKQNSTQGGK
mgnify:CR=1 FL=1